MVATLLANLFRLIGILLALPWRLARSPRRPTFIRFNLRGDLPYFAMPRRRWFRRRKAASEVQSIESLRRQLKTLQRDPSVRGVVVTVQNLTISRAKREAVIGLLEELKKSGKQVLCHTTQASSSEFEVLCAADRILVAPGGRIELTGFAAETMALGEGLRQMGIKAHFVRRGEYKTAPELFTDASVSDVQRRTVERFLDDQFQVLIDAISKGRNLSVEEAARKVDGGPYSAPRALAEGLCDELCPESDLEPGSKATTADARFGTFLNYTRAVVFPAMRLKPLKRRPRVGVVPLHGLIMDGEGGMAPGSWMATADRVVECLRAAARDSRAQALILYVGSPGGSAMASERILEEVKATAGKKPLVAYVDRVAASGGYLASLGATEIWAAPHALVGSIGVFAGKFEFSNLFRRAGIFREVLTRGENAGLSSISRPFTESERSALEAEVEDAYQLFLERVAQGRGMTKDEAHARGEGRVYTGHEALKERLVDRTGSFDQASLRALELAGKKVSAYDVMFYAPRARPLSHLSLLRRVAATRLFALWYPWLSISGLGGSDGFG